MADRDDEWADGDELGWRRFRALATSAFDMISEVDRAGRVTYVSPNHAALHGVGPGDAAGSLGFDRVHPDDQPAVARAFAGLFRDGESARATFRAIGNEGQVRWIECTGTPVTGEDGEVRALLLSREVTEQKQTEARLLASRERFRNIAENAYDMIAELDLGGRVTFANDQITRSLGIAPDGAWKQGPEMLLHPDDREATVAAWQEVVAGGEPAPVLYRVGGTNGQWRWIEARYRRSVNASGEHHVVVIARDLTEAREAERRRVESEERYRVLVEDSPQGIFVVVDDRIVFTNAAGAGVCGGRRPEDVVGCRMFDLLEPEFAASVADQLVRIERGEPMSDLIEVRLRGLDGVTRDAVATGRLIEYEGRPAYQGIVRDVTGLRAAEREQNRLELQLQEARKLESLGMLAGGIAHDFNNLLSVILGNTRFAQRQAGGGEVADALGDAIDAAEQAARLTQQLLAYAGRRAPEVRTTDLSELVRSRAELLRSVLPGRVELAMELEAGLPSVRADVVQLEQVLMNLVINAGDAIGDAPGRVRLASGCRSVRADEIAHWVVGGAELTPGEYVYLEVADSGTGIDAATRERIFEPFFTTRREGHGLGLAAVLGLVRGHRGGVDLESHPGQETCFRVYLPAEPETAPQPSRGAVLLVTGDPERRRRLTTAFSACRVQTLAADDEEEAIDLLRRHGDEVEAALCAIDSAETLARLARALRAECPALPLLLSAARPSDALLRELLRAAPAAILAPTSDPAALEAGLEALLGKPRGR